MTKKKKCKTSLWTKVVNIILLYQYLLFVIVLLIGVILALTSCAHVNVRMNKCQAPPMPTFFQINVIDGQLTLEEKNKIVENWVLVWQYIHDIKAKCGIVDLDAVSAATGIDINLLKQVIREHRAAANLSDVELRQYILKHL